jgi:D-alanyl-D-alanine carboxypeptidase/D-alanyl-D-alanine-endopeptidase (penicillin-binding protein 4)
MFAKNDHVLPIFSPMSKKISALCLTGWFVAFLFTTAYAQGNLTKKIDQVLGSSPAISQSFTGLVVYDLKRKKTIYDQFGNRYFTPASNTKLLTYAVGNQLLADRFPALRYLEMGDSLVFWGTGFPLTLHPFFQDSTVLTFLANQRKQLFYREVPSIVERFGPGWGWSEYGYYYSSERSSLPIHANNVLFEFSGNASELKVTPAFFQRFVQKNYGSPPSGVRTVERDEHQNTFYYYVQLDTFSRGWKQFVPFTGSPALTASVLSDVLQKEVTVWQGKLDIKKAQTVYASGVDTVYRKMLQDSDNLLAEQILMMCASELGDTLDIERAINWGLENWFKGREPLWVDGSGLSRYNLITPNTLIFTLEKLWQEVGRERLFNELPAGGVSGTISGWYPGKDGPYVFAKTGTLRGQHCLSGYLVTRKGEVLAFSFMHNQFTVPSAQVRRLMQEVLEMIRDQY